MFATGRTRRLLAEVSLRCKFDAAESTMELVSFERSDRRGRIPAPSNCLSRARDGCQGTSASGLLEYTKTSTTLFLLLYLNYIICYYLNIKVDFSLPSKYIILANYKATILLLLFSILNTRL